MMKCLGISLLLLIDCTGHAAAIVISGWLTNVNGDDSPYEYAQLVATQEINFQQTPHTVVWNDVGVVGSTGTASFSDGWAGGSLLSYAFELTSGSVARGEIFYVGGAAQLLAGPGSASLAGERWLRTINTAITAGDGLGAADPNGVFGNGGPNADGIAVFRGLASALTSTTVPLDSVFFGNAVGTAHPPSGGFKAAENDRYTSAGVFGDPGNAYLFSDLAQNQFERLSGTYNVETQQWEVARTDMVITLNSGSQASDIGSGIILVPEPSAGLLVSGAIVLLGMRRRHPAFQSYSSPPARTGSKVGPVSNQAAIVPDDLGDCQEQRRTLQCEWRVRRRFEDDFKRRRSSLGRRGEDAVVR